MFTMTNHRITILYIFLILETSVSFPLQQGEKLQQQSTFQNIPSTIKINNNSSVSTGNSTSGRGSLFNTYTIIGMAVGGAIAVVGVLALPALLGFTTAGIAATTAAAGMMSSTAVASGGGVAAGSLVALLQSAGVLGVTASTGGLVATASAGTIGASIGFGMGYTAQKVFMPVSLFATNAHNETVAFFTGNGTKSWKSFTNWTEANVDYAVFKIKNGTVDSWEKVKVGTIDSWDTLSNWTIVNTEKVTYKMKNGPIDAWNTIKSWTTSSAASSYTPVASKIIFIGLFYNLITSYFYTHISTFIPPPRIVNQQKL